MTIPRWKAAFEKTAGKDDMELSFNSKHPPRASWSTVTELTPQQKKTWAAIEKGGLTVTVDKSGKLTCKNP